MSDITVKLNGKKVDKSENPLLWWCIAIVGQIVGAIATFVLLLCVFAAFALTLVVIGAAIPICIILDIVLWVLTREHYFVHLTDEKLYVGWKQGSKYQ